VIKEKKGSVSEENLDVLMEDVAYCLQHAMNKHAGAFSLTLR
jgi:hypothetical protein